MSPTLSLLTLLMQFSYNLPLPSPLLAGLPPAPASLPLHPPSTLFQMITRTSNIFSWRDYHRTVKYKGC